jgi:hypothetical protein
MLAPVRDPKYQYSEGLTLCNFTNVPRNFITYPAILQVSSQFHAAKLIILRILSYHTLACDILTDAAERQEK